MISLNIQPGILAGLLVGLGAIGIHFLPKYKWVAAGVLIAAIAPVALSGFIFPSEVQGISDWDYYLSYYHNMLRTITQFNQFPLWNPWTCGGTAALGDPEFPLFSPLFGLDLLFGESLGLRLSILLSVIVGSWGVLALSKKMGFSVYAGLVAVCGIFFGSVNLLENVEGHQNVLSTMCIPWLFWAWYSAYAGVRPSWRIYYAPHTLLAGLFITLIFFQGGIFILTYTALALLILILLAPRHLQALYVSVGTGMWALGLAAVKLLPTIFWLQQFQKPAYASSVNTLAYLNQIFLGRYLHTYVEIIPGQGSAWHQYGAYIGPFVLTLAVAGMIAGFKRRAVIGLTIAAALAIILSASGPYFKPFFDIASFLPRSNINRAILYAVIPLGLLAAQGLDSITSKGKKMRLLGWLLITAAAVDVMTLANGLSQQAFVVPEHVPAISPAPSPIAFINGDFKTRVDGVDYARTYNATQAGWGTMNYCSVLTPPPAVRVISDEGDNGVLVVASEDRKDRGTYTVDSWTPNKVMATVLAKGPSTVTLNTNFAKGWTVNNQEAISIDGRVGGHVAAGTQQITFQYHPRGVLAGTLVTLASMIIIMGILTNWSRKRSVEL
jgi:hypothetical protein